ncbi:Uma2 family endonuclease [Benzoatithermus flavus]|uniref:Uma2 family endonuclease n=1 Tax=Benzoatithermus flavus TaxID=3108223 RepID=A0ABU8XSJ8_9PROT
MGELARTSPPRMTLEEFLRWDDGTDTRYELDRGELVAMAPARERHGVICQNADSVIERAVEDRPPCRAVQQPSVLIDATDHRFYTADVALTCEPPEDRLEVATPRLVVEVLSSSTEGVDKHRKVAAYGELPSVEEIRLIDSRQRWMLVWQRVEGAWVAGLPLTGEASFASRVLGVDVTLERLYRHTGL